jgi:RimJ/RimL family protein N-acetyltransferase
MIEELRKKDIDEAVKVWKKGLTMEIPEGTETNREIRSRLKEFRTFVYKEKDKIIGLLSFTFEEDGSIDIVFICTMVLRKKIGTKLISKLAKFALKNKIHAIYSNVSPEDERAMSFYKRCGFRRFGKPYIDAGVLLYKIRAKPMEITASN